MFFTIFISGCINPFAPALDEDINDGSSIISEQTDVNGVFTNLQYAYTFEDTTIYGNLLSSDFTFIYHDYEQGFDIQWGRDEEMKVTNALFQNSQNLDIIWNKITFIDVDSTSITRSYNLTVTFNPTDIQRIDGKSIFTLRKNLDTRKWQIVRWYDESNF